MVAVRRTLAKLHQLLLLALRVVVTKPMSLRLKDVLEESEQGNQPTAHTNKKHLPAVAAQGIASAVAVAKTFAVADIVAGIASFAGWRGDSLCFSDLSVRMCGRSASNNDVNAITITYFRSKTKNTGVLRARQGCFKVVGALADGRLHFHSTLFIFGWVCALQILRRSVESA